MDCQYAPLVEIKSVEGLKEMVRQGIGVTLTLPALIRPYQIGHDLVLLPITDLIEEFIFALVYRRIGSISRAAREFISTISQRPWIPGSHKHKNILLLYYILG